MTITIPKHSRNYHGNVNAKGRTSNILRLRNPALDGEPSHLSVTIGRIRREIVARLKCHKAVPMADVEGLDRVLEYAWKLRAGAAGLDGGIAGSDREAKRRLERLEAVLRNFAKRVSNGPDLEAFTLLNSVLRSGNAGDEIMKAILQMSWKAGRDCLLERMRLFDTLAQNMPASRAVFDAAIGVIADGKFPSREKALPLLCRITKCRGFHDDFAEMLGTMWITPSEDAYWDTYVLHEVLDHWKYSDEVRPAVMTAMRDLSYPSRWRLDLLLSAMENAAFAPSLVRNEGLMGSICSIADAVMGKGNPTRVNSFFYVKRRLAKCTQLNATAVNELAVKVRGATTPAALMDIFMEQKFENNDA